MHKHVTDIVWDQIFVGKFRFNKMYPSQLWRMKLRLGQQIIKQRNVII